MNSTHLGIVAALAALFPVSAAGQDAPIVHYDFEVPEFVEDVPGSTVGLRAYATLEPTGDAQVQGWSFSMTADGATITEISIEGLSIEGGELQNSFFRRHELAVDPEDPDRAGAVGVLLGIGYTQIHLILPVDVPHRVAWMTLELDVPGDDDCRTASLYYEDGFEGSGQPVNNIFTHVARTYAPELVRRDIDVCGFDDEPFRRGDANADGALDISDAGFLFNYLFLGTAYPSCFDASDVNDDGELSIVDPVYLLNHLFYDFAAPPQPSACGEDPTDDALTCWANTPCE